MRLLSKILIAAAVLGAATVAEVATAQSGYVPAAVYCVSGGAALCPTVPGDIGPDPMLANSLGYQGIMTGSLPTSAARDVETPFDNLSWQTFVALNWRADKTGRPPAEGLGGEGPRVWEKWARVSQVFGNSPVLAHCIPGIGEEVFQIASNGNHTPAINNEEYIQAATGDPAIDVNGNWTLYERRINGTEIAYLKAPGGASQPTWNLTTANGQTNFVNGQGKIDFPAGTSMTSPGAMEIKAAWRLLDPAKHAANARRYYIVRALVAVAPDLVFRNAGKSAPICAHVELGLVAMHIIQKNPVTNNELLPQWFWTTFEQVDNAPLAAQACDLVSPVLCKIPQNTLPCPPVAGTTGDYAYYNGKAPDVPTNQPPKILLGGVSFMWDPSPPYAGTYMVKAKSGLKVGTQIARCWQIYALTQQLNQQWQAKLKAVGSVFANYALIGTQWGAKAESPNPPPVPPGAVPGALSNTVVETYLQNAISPHNPFGNGSCVSCHVSANLTTYPKTLSNLSFVPGLVVKKQTRRAPIKPDAL